MKSSLPLTEQDLTDFATALEETTKDFKALRQRYTEVREAFSSAGSDSGKKLPRGICLRPS